MLFRITLTRQFVYLKKRGVAFDGALKVEDPAIEGTRGERTTAGLMPLGLFLCFGGHLPQTSARSKQYLPVIFGRLVFIRQNFHERWCRKLLAI